MSKNSHFVYVQYTRGMHLFVRPMTLTSRLERVPGLGAALLAGAPAQAGDVLIIAATSGRNAVVIDMALAARAQGLLVIGITALAYTQGVSSRHPSGKKLVDLCDIVIDNGAPYGDAVVEIPGFPQKVGPLSSLTGIAIVNALVAEEENAGTGYEFSERLICLLNTDAGKFEPVPVFFAPFTHRRSLTCSLYPIQ